MSDIPEKPNVPIRFALNQDNTEVVGTFAWYGNTDSIRNGSNIRNFLSFTTCISFKDSNCYHFEGFVSQDSVIGNWSVVSMSNNDILSTNEWFVARDHEGK
jgi:hypothetical protein